MGEPCATTLGIPPTAVGGFFRSNLQRGWTLEPRESHQRQLVDLSNPTYLSIWKSTRPLRSRPDLNNPPTAVGGIQEHGHRYWRRSDLNDPPTAVGGISKSNTFLTHPHEPTLMAALLLAVELFDLADEPITVILLPRGRTAGPTFSMRSLP